jgi:hypothetical protein
MSTKRMKWSQEITLTWSSDWPKEWPLSVQSSSTTTLMDRISTVERGCTRATLEGGLMPKFVNRHPPIGSEYRIQLWIQKMTECRVKSKDDLVTSQIKRWPSAKSNPRNTPSEPKDLAYPQKFLLRVVAHLGNPKPFFLLASSNLGDEISFKGGSL